MCSLNSLHKPLIISFFIFGVIVFAYPLNNDLIFNGLPFDNPQEVILLCIILPIILYKKIWRYKIAFKVFFLFILIKLVSFYAPERDFVVKQYLVLDNEIKKEVKSYNSIFNNDKSFISNGKKTYKEMPYSWMNVYNPNGILEISNYNLPNKYKINFQISGKFNVNQNQNYLFDFSKLEQVDLKLIDNKSKKITSVFSENKIYEIELKNSNYSIIGELVSFGNETWFDIKNSKDQLTDIYNDKYLSKRTIKLGFYLKYIELCLIVFSLCLVFIKNAKRNFLKYVNNYIFEFLNILILFSLSLFFYHYGYFNLISGINIIFNKSFLIAFYLLIFLMIALFKIFSKKQIYSNKECIYFVIAPTVLFFSLYYSENIFHTYFHSKGDDWAAFEKFSYQILIMGEYIRAGEDFFYFRPLMRYIMSFFYLIFGQSFFPLQLFEIYGIIFCAYTIKYIGEVLGNKKYSLILSLIFLITIFGETFKINLGKGITEYYSLAFLSIYIFYLFKLQNSKLIYIIPIYGALGFWLREDHLPVTLFCTIILLSDLKITDFKINNCFKNKQFRKVLIINIILIIYFLLLGIRNYFVGGDFRISHFQVGKVNTFIEILRDNIYPLIAGNTIEHLPRTFSILILFAIFLSLRRILNFFYNLKYLKLNYILFPLLLIISILPYFYVANNGYPPRYSLMILYFAILVFSTSKIKKLQ
jgi:hypothetical protein